MMYDVGTLRAALMVLVILSIAKDLGSIHVGVTRSFTPFRMTRLNSTLGCRRQ